jgi:hypothetical protein
VDGDRQSRIRLLVVSKGHAFAHDSFRTLFDPVPWIDWTLCEQPAAEMALQPDVADAWDVVFFYDMSGVLPDPGDPSAGPPQPSPAYERAIRGLLERGTGLMLFNHGTLSWPAWPLWRTLSQTSFLLEAGEVHGRQLPGSGFRGGWLEPEREATTTLTPVHPEHPVLENLEAGFELKDELYLKSPCFEQYVTPLLRSDFTFTDDAFSPPPLASKSERAAWAHPPGSDCVVWANAIGNSQIVAGDLGDGPGAYENPGFRTLIHNSVRWLAGG